MGGTEDTDALASENEGSGGSHETILRRRPFSLMAVLLSLAYFFGVASNFASRGAIGVDFGVFRAGGVLIRDRGFDAAYDQETFINFVANDYPTLATETETITAFISPPTFGWFAQIFGALPLTPALISWYVVGFVLIAASCHMLELPRWAPFALAISPVMALNTTLGQTGAFIFFLFTALHVQLRNERVVAAGVTAGLMILKPPIAFGYGLLWLIRLRTSAKAIVAALVTGVVISIPTITGGFDPWVSFIDVMAGRTGIESGWPTQAASVSEFIKLLFPNSASWVTLLGWGLGVVVAGLMLMAANRRYGDDPEVMSAAAVIASVIGSPHVLPYDSLMLVIPFAVAYRRGLLTGRRVGMLALLMTIAFGLGAELYFVQLRALSRGIGIEFPILAVCTYLLVRWDAEQNAQSGGEVIDFPSGQSFYEAA